MTTVRITLGLALAMGLSAGAAFAQPQALDHLKCYKVKDSAKFVAGVTLEALQAQFGLEDCRVIGKAKFFCAPVDKTVTAFEDKTKPPLSPVPFPGQKLGEDRLCYKIKCPKVAIADLEVTDQFGTRRVGKFKPLMLCTPAKKGPKDPPNECDLTGPQCNGLCPDPNQICRPITGTTQCECKDPQDAPCDDAAAPKCNGVCPDPADVCRPKANDAGCTCAKPPVPCSQSAPQCNGDCPAGAQCFLNAAGECDCFDVPVLCEDSIAPQCGGACPAPLVCQFNSATDRCECADQGGTGNKSCTDPGLPAPQCDGTCPSGFACGPGGAAPCECEPTTLACGDPSAPGPPQCFGECGAGGVCFDDGTGGCSCL